MNNHQVLLGEQLRYRKPISIVKEQLNKLHIKPETDIRVTPIYPSGWYATVGASLEDLTLAYVFTCEWGQIFLDIKECRGFLKNGNMILKDFFERSLK